MFYICLHCTEMEKVLIFCPYFSILVFIFPVFAKKIDENNDKMNQVEFIWLLLFGFRMVFQKKVSQNIDIISIFI